MSVSIRRELGVQNQCKKVIKMRKLFGFNKKDTNRNTLNGKLLMRPIICNDRYFPLHGCGNKTKLDMDSFMQMPKEYVSLYTNMKKKMLYFKGCNIKETKPAALLKEINDIFPNSFFGPIKHRKCIRKIIKLIITRSKNECVFNSDLIRGWDVNTVPWLINVNSGDKKNVLLYGLKIVLNNIVLVLFRHQYTPVFMGQSNEIKFIPRILWTSTSNKIVHYLIKRGHMIPMQYTEELATLVRGRLAFKPKKNITDITSMRPYVRLFQQTFNIAYSSNYITRKLFIASARFSISKTDDFYECWNDYSRRNAHKTIYGVKLDIEDCFGNVNIDVMSKVLQECELGVVILNFLLRRIRNQYVYFSSEKYHYKRVGKIYKWNHGLLQGDTFSGPLCNLYISHLESLHLQYIKKNENCLLHRSVDDYFVVSTDRQDVLRFISDMHKCVSINIEKTQTNIYNNDLQDIHYGGKIINLKTMQIKTLWMFPEKTQMNYRFKLWNKYNQLPKIALLLKTLHFPYNAHYFSKDFLNVSFNVTETVLNNFFKAMIYVALKFDSSIIALCLTNPCAKTYKFIENLISEFVTFYSRKCLLKTGNQIKFNHLIKIGYQAIILVFKRRQYFVYKKVVNYVKLLQKQNYTKGLNMKPFLKIPSEFRNIHMGRNFYPMMR